MDHVCNAAQTVTVDEVNPGNDAGSHSCKARNAKGEKNGY